VHVLVTLHCCDKILDINIKKKEIFFGLVSEGLVHQDHDNEDLPEQSSLLNRGQVPEKKETTGRCQSKDRP
jgi:hypothetical protein